MALAVAMVAKETTLISHRQALTSIIRATKGKRDYVVSKLIELTSTTLT